MKKSFKKSKKIIILSVVLVAFFCLSAFNSAHFSPRVSAEDGDAYFYGDFIKVEGTTYRDLGITGWYTESDTIDVSPPSTGNDDNPYFGYYNISYTTNSDTDQKYTINIYNLFYVECPEVTENTVMEISTTNNLRFYINNWDFYSGADGDEVIFFIPTNKTINLFNLLEKVYYGEMTEYDQELYPGTPQYSFLLDVYNNIFDLFYTHNLDDKEDTYSVFSNLCGFVIGQNGFISNTETDHIEKTTDGVYYYSIYEEYYTWRYFTVGNYGSDKVYLNFQPFDQTAGGFYLADENIQVNNAGRLGQSYTFDFAQVDGYGKNKFFFGVGTENGSQILYDQFVGRIPLDDKILDFNCIMLDYPYNGEIYALYEVDDPILPYVQYSSYQMKMIKSSMDFINFATVIDNNIYYNSFCCCFSPYVGEVKILSTDQPTQKFQSGRIANIVSAALWVAALPIMLIGSIVNGITAATSGGNFLDGFGSWTKSISDGIADMGTNVSDFFEDLNKLLPSLPDPVKDLSEDPTTWIILLLIAVIAVIIVLFFKTRKNS